MVNWPWTLRRVPALVRDGGVGVGDFRPAPPPDTEHMQEPVAAGYQFPMPPLRPHASTPFLLWAFARAGMKPFPSPRGINYAHL